MKTKNIIIYILICLIIIAGIAVWNAKGFKTELQYSSRKQIVLSNYTGIEISDIESIVKEVLGDKKFSIQRVETFGNTVAIISKDITEEQRNQIVEKFNNKYSTELKSDNVQIESIPFTRIKDIIKPHILTGLICLIFTAIYTVIRYRKLGWKNVLAQIIFIPVVAELLMFSIISIIRMPISRLTVSLAIVLYLISVIVITCILENKRGKYIEELEKNQ